MILTKKEIKKEIIKGNIVISPFQDSQLNPNSYNYRLGNKMKIFSCFDNISRFEEIVIPDEGLKLEPLNLYLGQTYEVIGSTRYAISLIGRSSMGRLGVFLQCSANLGHTGCNHQWTLEIVTAMPFIVYPKMIIGQISFWCNHGELDLYNGFFGSFNEPRESRV